MTGQKFLDLTCSSPLGDPSVFGIDPIIISGGWWTYHQQKIAPAIAAGCEMVVLHLPFGCVQKEPYRFGMFARYGNANLKMADMRTPSDPHTPRPVAGWNLMMQTLQAKGVRAIVYLGAPRGTAESENAITVDDPIYMGQVAGELDVLVKSGATDIIIDGLAMAPVGSTAFNFAQYLNASGWNVAVEPCPTVVQPQWIGTPFLSSWWVIRDGGLLVRPFNTPPGERSIGFYGDASKNENPTPELIAGLLAQGYNVGVQQW